MKEEIIFQIQSQEIINLKSKERTLKGFNEEDKAYKKGVTVYSEFSEESKEEENQDKEELLKLIKDSSKERSIEQANNKVSKIK